MDLLSTRTRRRLLFGALYLSEGAPIGYLWWALPTQLRDAGVPVAEVTALTALLTVPWTFKFVWAPLVDAFPSRRLGLRPWIVGSQVAMGLTLVPLLWIDLAAERDWLVWILLAHAFCAATQDVSIDALAIRRIPLDERGSATGVMQLGMLLGRSLFGGALLSLESSFGRPPLIAALIVTVLCSSGLACLAHDEVPPARARGGFDRLRRFAATLRDVLSRRTTWIGIAFAALAGSAMEAAAGMAGPMMIDLDIGVEAVGAFFALPVVVAMATGALAGGWLADRYRRERTAGAAVLLLALCVAATSGAVAAGSQTLLVGSLTSAYFSFGVLTAATYAVLMDLTDPRLGATQFSTYMGAINLCYVWSAWAGGAIAGAAGYPTALLVMAACSLLALPLLPALARRAPVPPAG